ncbi:MAG: NYN domain-containing protein [Spirochaetales bacterium]|uniref:NYN domain-containing protein n=1 Tax=Candidatus Thalassospirochaeta sargassi TaxID=3119039 RepID=A0AAJ1MIF7_9SPIO|nr:NYN domain-containing protein [Spirochaetales bacterium]
MKESIAILWDIENVTPRSDSLFVNGLIEYASELGKVSVATAYGDWARGSIRKTSEALAENSFEMVHVPYNKKQKNSADMALSTHAVELIYMYPHIKKIILVTGDADFRPLLQSLRKHGIETIIICDSQSASEDLLLLADDYKDFRDLIPDTEDEDSGDSKDGVKTDKISLPDAMDLLKEAIVVMNRRKKVTTLGAVKVRMKLLNDTFNETALGFRSWKKFIMHAEKEGVIELDQSEKDQIIRLPESDQKDTNRSRVRLPNIMYSMMKATRDCAEKTGKSLVPFSQVNNRMLEQNYDIKQSQYSQMKRLVKDAEKRGLVRSSNKGKYWFVEMTDDGNEYFN